MAINDILEHVLQMNFKGQKLINRRWFRQQDADGALSPEQALMDTYEAGILPQYQACCSDDLSFTGQRVRRILPIEGGSFVGNLAVAGTIIQDGLPPNSAMVITFYSSTLTKAGRGRMFVSGIPDTLQADGIADEAYQILLMALANQFMGAIGVGGGEPNFMAGVADNFGGGFAPFSKYEVRTYAHTLRSRRMENP